MPKKLENALQSEAKTAVRRLWLELISDKEGFNRAAEQPLYLTLPGSRGLDIQLLVDKGLLEVTETGAVRSPDLVVAFERNPRAHAAVKKQFPGLRVFEHDLIAIMNRADISMSPVHARFLDAVFINLDLEYSLEPEIVGKTIRFPVIDMAVRFAHIKATNGRTKYGLFLTLNATMSWDTPVKERVAEAIRGNLKQDEEFRAAVEARFGTEWVERLQRPLLADKGELDLLFNDLGSQRFLQLYVPKTIAYRLHSEGWRVTTQQNWRYGGESKAPMVTFIFVIERDPRGAGDPRPLYIESLRTVVSCCGEITDEGEFTPDKVA